MPYAGHVRRFGSSVTVVVIGLACAACGSGSSPTHARAATTRTTPSPAPTSTGSSGPSLTAQLVRVDQLPAGWAVQPGSTSAVPNTCVNRPFEKVHHTDKVTAYFQDSGGLPELQEVLVTVPNGPAGFASAKAAANRCHNATSTVPGSSNGLGQTSGTTTVTLHQTPMSWPAVGQESNAWSITGHISGVNIGADSILVRVGNTLASISVVDVASPSTSQAEQLVNLAVSDLADQPGSASGG